VLESLHLTNVGPAPEMSLELAPRLNLITGDNGLGKSFLLDVAWWVLTGTWPATWPGHGAVPSRTSKTVPSIAWSERRGERRMAVQAPFDFGSQTWSPAYKSAEDAEKPCLVVFVRVDGGFSIWDPLRKGEPYRLPYGESAWGQSSAFQFSATDVWDGLTLQGPHERPVCEGFWRDVVMWQLDPDAQAFHTLSRVVQILSSEERVTLTRKRAPVVVGESRESPLLQTPYGQVPVVHASAAFKRVLGLAYMLVWTWREHAKAAQLHRVAPARELVILVDEIEAHLHPKWQRSILPALLEVGQTIHADLRSQIVATTHSPLVLASMEPHFDAERDAWFDLDIVDRGAKKAGRVQLEKRPFVRHGDAGRWLTSEAFDLASEGRSIPAEHAIEKARDASAGRQPPRKSDSLPGPGGHIHRS
jgi:hypothetical protein